MSWTHYNNPIFSGNIKTWSPIEDNGLVNHYFVIEHTGSTTGIQTSFSLPSNTKVSDYCSANGLTLIEGDPDATTNTSRGFSVQGPKVLLQNYDTTDNGLSELSNLTTGVTHTIDKQGTDVYEVDEDTHVIIQGTLNHDPDREILVINFKRPSHATNAHFYSALKVNGIYNFGVETSVGNRTSYSTGGGLFIVGDALMGNWNPRDSALSGSGALVGRGGVITLNKMISYGGTLDVKKTNFVGTPSGALLEWRTPFGKAGSSFDGFFTGYGIIKPTAFPATLGLKKATIGEVISDSLYEGTLKDFDVSQNVADYDIGHDGMTNRGHGEWFILNSETGTDVKSMWRDTRGHTGQRGVTIIQKEVSFNFLDADGSVVEGVQLYLEDNPSPYAKDATFVASKHKEGKTYEDRPNARGEINSSGDLIYKYLNSITYSKSSDANGAISTFIVTTGTQIHEFNCNDEDAVAIYGMSFSGDRWRVSSSNNNIPVYDDWDTDKFGGFYKVDRRGNDNTNADLFTFKFCSYKHSLSSSTQALKGLGELSVNWVLFDDQLITDTIDLVDAYTEINTPQKFYDKAKAYLVAHYNGESQTIVSRNGVTINAGYYDVVISDQATEVFACDGSTITIKANAFSGNLTTTGSVTLTGSSFIGTIIDSSGTRSFGGYKIANLESGSRLQIYNVTQGTEIFNGIVNSTEYEDSFITEMTDGDSIRIRVCYQDGLTAKEPQELQATCRLPNWEISASQATALNYSAYNLDGSSVDEFSLDLEQGKIEVNISDSDNTTEIQRIASWYYAELMTANGIANLFGALNWISLNQIRIESSKVDLKIDNIKSSPLLLTGGRMFRSDDQPIIASASNSIQIDYSPVYIGNAPLIEQINRSTRLIPALL